MHKGGSQEEKAVRNSEGCLEHGGCLVPNFGLGDGAAGESARGIQKAVSG